MGWRVGSSWPRAALQDWPSLYLNQTRGAPQAFRRESQATFCLYRENASFPFSVPLSATIAARAEGDVEGPVGLPGERAGVGAHSSEEGGLGPRGWRPEGTNRGQRPGQ